MAVLMAIGATLTKCPVCPVLAGHPVHLGTVLARCPHYLSSMRTKWGMPKQAGDSSCVLL